MAYKAITRGVLRKRLTQKAGFQGPRYGKHEVYTYSIIVDGIKAQFRTMGHLYLLPESKKPRRSTVCNFQFYGVDSTDLAPFRETNPYL